MVHRYTVCEVPIENVEDIAIKPEHITVCQLKVGRRKTWQGARNIAQPVKH